MSPRATSRLAPVARAGSVRRPDRRSSVVVAGVGESGPVPADARSIPEMVLAAVEAVLADAQLSHDDIDAVVTASVDLFDGLTASNVAITEVVGAVMKPETRIAGDGLAALVHAYCQVKAGAYRTVLVVAHGKPSMSDHDALTRWAMDPIHLQPLGVDLVTCAGLEACLMAERDRDAPARWAELAAARARAAGRQADAASVLASPVVASPITAGMRAPLADGACAVILRARAGSGPGITVSGVGHDLSPHALGDRLLEHRTGWLPSPGAPSSPMAALRPPHLGVARLGRRALPSTTRTRRARSANLFGALGAWQGLQRACERAYAMAGVARSEDDFDVVEPSCGFAHQEELFASAAGVGPRVTRSPSGGLFAGAVPVAAGLSRCAAAVRWLRAAGGGRALAHGAWGPAAQGHAVAVLEVSP